MKSCFYIQQKKSGPGTQSVFPEGGQKKRAFCANSPKHRFCCRRRRILPPPSPGKNLPAPLTVYTVNAILHFLFINTQHCKFKLVGIRNMPKYTRCPYKHRREAQY